MEIIYILKENEKNMFLNMFFIYRIYKNYFNSQNYIF